MTENTDKIRVSVTLTQVYVEALDKLIADGFYLSRGQIILESLRKFLKEQKVEPFYTDLAEKKI